MRNFCDSIRRTRVVRRRFLYLATSDEPLGLVAQGRTIAETLEIARDVARRLIEARSQREGTLSLPTASERHEYTIVVAS